MSALPSPEPVPGLHLPRELLLELLGAGLHGVDLPHAVLQAPPQLHALGLLGTHVALVLPAHALQLLQHAAHLREWTGGDY